MVSVLALNEVEFGRVKPDYEIGNCCFSAEHAALRSKSKDWLVGIRIM